MDNDERIIKLLEEIRDNQDKQLAYSKEVQQDILHTAEKTIKTQKRVFRMIKGFVIFGVVFLLIIFGLNTLISFWSSSDNDTPTAEERVEFDNLAKRTSTLLESYDQAIDSYQRDSTPQTLQPLLDMQAELYELSREWYESEFQIKTARDMTSASLVMRIDFALETIKAFKRNQQKDEK